MQQNSPFSSTQLPKVLIVGEAPLSPNLSGTGQTIYNLFVRYPAEKIVSYVPEVKKELFHIQDLKVFLSQPFRNKVVVYNTRIMPMLRNRFGTYLNRWAIQFNIQWLQWFGKRVPKEIRAFNPELVLICPNEDEGMLKGYLMAKKLDIPFVIFLMDDWMCLSKLKWWGNNTGSLTRLVLKESAGWIMISKQLKNLLAERYGIQAPRFCVAHNPVSTEGKPYVPPLSRTKKRIVYAGSIWPMHYDSLLAMAQGTYLLRQEGVEIELVVYSFEHFWEQYKSILAPLEVCFGGRVAYQDLHPLLQEADLLLVTSTFGEQYKSHSLSSLQTKVTDYMIAGRSILACGPSYSACNLFVKDWECGVLCETKEPTEVALLLKAALADETALTTMGKKGYEAAVTHFNEETLCQGLYDLLKEVAR